MTTPRRVQRHRSAAKARTRVRSTGTVGRRVRAPQPPTAWASPKRKQPPYRGSVGLGCLSGFLVVVFAATGSIFAAVGALTSAGAGVGVAYLEYRRDLIEVKRTGKPIGAKDRPAAERTDDLEDVPEPEPVDLDQPPRARPAPQRRAQRPATGDHASRCTAKSQSTCRCPDGPNRKGAKKPVARRR